MTLFTSGLSIVCRPRTIPSAYLCCQQFLLSKILFAKHLQRASTTKEFLDEITVSVEAPLSATYSRTPRHTSTPLPVHKSNDMSSFRYKYFSENDDFPPFSIDFREKQ